MAAIDTNVKSKVTFGRMLQGMRGIVSLVHDLGDKLHNPSILINRFITPSTGTRSPSAHAAGFRPDHRQETGGNRSRLVQPHSHGGQEGNA